MTTDALTHLSEALAARVTAVDYAVSVHAGRRPFSGILWRPDVVVTSEQVLGEPDAIRVVHNGTTIGATLAGRDAGTNVAVLRLQTPIPGSTLPSPAASPTPGALTLVIGATPEGAATARLAMVHAVGGEWHSMAGGRIEALVRLDSRLGPDEGGPVLSATGDLLGMSTAGPRRRTLVIPAATITRVLEPLLTDGRIARGWLGVGLQSVTLPDSLRATCGQDTGLMVIRMASGAPAEQAGILPGDILLDVDGQAARRGRWLSTMMGPERIGQTVTVRLIRAGAMHSVSAVIAARPGA